MSSFNDSLKTKIQSRVVEILKTSNYSLNVVNRYKENIVHLSAANNCTEILKCILDKHDKCCLERKNSFGWTPLMQAVRNENIEMVKFLQSFGVHVNDFSFLGMSVVSLACAISNEMFDLLYNNCPSALEYASHDDINPLCIAALKKDRELFFKLIHLGLDVNNANAFTHIMMKQSEIADIVALAKTNMSSDDYWNDLSSIEDCLEESNVESNKFNDSSTANFQDNINNFKKNNVVPNIFIEDFRNTENENVLSCHKKAQCKLHLSDNYCQSEALISPTLSYFKENPLPMSPNIHITTENLTTIFPRFELNVEEQSNPTPFNNCHNQLPLNNIDQLSPLVLQRCQDKRPPNLMLRSLSNDSDTTLSFTPQFSRIKTPNLPHDVNEDDVFDETTPTPPKYKTPPRGIITDPKITKLILLLKRFGLQRHVPLFVEQEIDLDLFLTLSDQDLTEIGIHKKSERLILLSVINECKAIGTYGTVEYRMQTLW